MSSHPTPKIICVDGIIGAGKSTYINNHLSPFLAQQGYRPIIVPEPVDTWTHSGRLQQFYDNPTRRAFQFQCRVFHDRIKVFLQLYNQPRPSPDNTIFILERSIFTDKIFMDVLRHQKIVDYSEYQDYLELWTMWSQLLPSHPDLFIYLSVGPHTAMERVKSRARPSEGQGVTLRYQQLLRQRHEDFLGRKQTLAILSPTLSAPILKSPLNLITDLDPELKNFFPTHS